MFCESVNLLHVCHHVFIKEMLYFAENNIVIKTARGPLCGDQVV